MHHIFTRTRLITLAASSFSLFLFSIVLAFVILPLVIDSQIDKNVRLERGSEQWHRFKELPFNISFNVTLFAVENPEEVVNHGAKPILREQGPYVFDQYLVKKNLVYNDNNNSVTYDRKIELIFNQTRSAGLSIDDTITMVNPIYETVMQLTVDKNLGGTAFIVDLCMKKMFNNTPFILKDYPIRNLIKDGVKICDFNTCIRIVCILMIGQSKLIEEIQEDGEHYMKFSFFNYKQILPDGLYEVNTGKEDISKVGNIEQWNFSNLTDLWDEGRLNNRCNVIKGTDGTIYPPHLDDHSSFDVFSTDICRVVPIHLNGSDTYRDIEGYIYKTKPSVFYSSVEDPSKDCYCPINKRTLDVDGELSCFLDGVIDIYSCIGLPVIISQPHFLNADKRYLQHLDGDIHPDPEKHELFVLLDKYTGIPLRAHKRMQMNLILRPVKGFDSSKNVARTILPLCWIDEGLDLPDYGINLLNSLLYDTLTIVNIVKWLFIGGTLCLTIFACILLAFHRYST